MGILTFPPPDPTSDFRLLAPTIVREARDLHSAAECLRSALVR